MNHRIYISLCTVGALHQLGDFTFSHVILDEAGFMTESESLLPLVSMITPRTRVIMAGDWMQLGPVIQARACTTTDLPLRLQESMLYRLASEKNNNPLYFPPHERPEFIVKLVENYRSHPAILTVSNQLFYEGEV